jgi:hypothetical protein
MENTTRKIVKDLENCQPNFRAYCKAHNLKSGDIWITYDYMAWIFRKDEEFRRLKGLRKDESMRPWSKEFTKFLEGEG